MNENTQNEIILLMKADNIRGTEQVKTLAIINDFLNCRKYMLEIDRSLDILLKHPEMDFKTDLTKIIFNIIKLNNECDYRKVICKSRSKYLIYGVLYYYLTKSQIDIINKINIGEMRILYLNAWDLINVNTEINKRPFYICLAQWWSFVKTGKLSV